MKEKANEKYGWAQGQKLPKRALDLIVHNNACKRACEKLVIEVVRHYEKADIAEIEMWVVIKKELKLSDDFDYQVEAGILYKRKKIDSQLAKIYENSEFRDAIAEIMRKGLRDKEV